MRTLYHWPLDPESRQARIALGEAKLKFKLKTINPIEPDESFLTLCPEGVAPLLVDTIAGGQAVIAGARAICEYVNDTAPKHSFLPTDIVERAEARRIAAWFDRKFADEVNAFLMHERVEKSLFSGGAPHPPSLREGRDHLAFHLDYLTWLLERRDWLAGRYFSVADIAAGANISCLDFLGEIPWKNYTVLKDWYLKFKCRPAVQPLLGDRIAGLLPPRHYRDLDF